MHAFRALFSRGVPLAGFKHIAGSILLVGTLLAFPAAPAGAASAPNLRHVVIDSAALGNRTDVNILLPDGYASSGRRYPVLYLLHPSGGTYRDWATQTDIVRYARHLPLIIVMSDGDEGWYVDAVGRGPHWETYHVHELIQYVDNHFRTIAARSGRAVAGASMGGQGAFAYAARHPDTY